MFRLPFVYYRLPFRGAGSRRLTEGLSRNPFTASKRFHENPSTAYRRSPSLFKGGFFQASLKGHPQGVPCAELASRRLD